MESTTNAAEAETLAPVQLPRITITFCTQCKWLLRAAYFAQELLSTFSTSLGEVSLIPSTGGVFTVDIVYARSDQVAANVHGPAIQTARLWDRKSEGRFPEVKSLKQLVRNVIDPGRDLGHVDRHHNEKKPGSTSDKQPTPTPTGQFSTGKTEGDQEQTLPTTDADAAVPGNIVSEEIEKENRKGNDPGASEACEDCK